MHGQFFLRAMDRYNYIATATTYPPCGLALGGRNTNGLGATGLGNGRPRASAAAKRDWDRVTGPTAAGVGLRMNSGRPTGTAGALTEGGPGNWACNATCRYGRSKIAAGTTLRRGKHRSIGIASGAMAGNIGGASSSKCRKM